MRFLPDSLEQIEESMERLKPLSNQLYEAFKEAIARVNRCQQGVDQPAMGETGQRDSEDEVLPE